MFSRIPFFSRFCCFFDLFYKMDFNFRIKIGKKNANITVFFLSKDKFFHEKQTKNNESGFVFSGFVKTRDEHVRIKCNLRSFKWYLGRL